MWSCPGNMPKYFPGLRHITLPFGRVICLSDLGNILAYYLDKITLLYKYYPIVIYRTHFVLVFNGCLKISIKKERKTGTKLKNNEPRNIL